MKVTFYGPSFSCFGIAEATAVVWVFIISLLLSGFLYSAELSFFFYFYVYVHRGKLFPRIEAHLPKFYFLFKCYKNRGVANAHAIFFVIDYKMQPSCEISVARIWEFVVGNC